MTPVARRLAEEHGIDASRVSGSGPGGRVMKEDVLGYIGRDAPAVAPDLAPAPPAPVPAPAAPGAAPPRPRRPAGAPRRRPPGPRSGSASPAGA